MEIPEGGLKKMLAEWIDSRDTRVVDEKQRSLTQEFLIPEIEAITQELAQLRKEFDRRIRGVLKKMLSRIPPQCAKDPSLRNPRKYPVGFGDTITDGVWVEVLKRMKYPSTPGMSAISRFNKRGGHLKQIAGIRHNRFFQNALQAGSLFVDTVNDTLDKAKPPVEICDLSQSGFSNIEDFSSESDVLEQHLGYKIFPQRVFPFLTPFFPVIRISMSGKVEMLMTHGLMAKNVFSDFSLAEDFIFRSRFSGEVLPPKLNDKIGKHFSWDEDNYALESGIPCGDIFYRGGAPDDLTKEVFERLRNIDPEHLPGFIEGSIGTTRGFNRLKFQL